MEQMVLPALKRGNYEYRPQVDIGSRVGGGRHLIDVLANHPGGKGILISLKWQQVSGTAEQKVPFEAICLADAIITGEALFQSAYLVLGGPGWKLRDFYVGGGLRSHLAHGDKVQIVTLETFVALANKGAL
jgi:hypothetical protein